MSCAPREGFVAESEKKCKGKFKVLKFIASQIPDAADPGGQSGVAGCFRACRTLSHAIVR